MAGLAIGIGLGSVGGLPDGSGAIAIPPPLDIWAITPATAGATILSAAGFNGTSWAITPGQGSVTITSAPGAV